MGYNAQNRRRTARTPFRQPVVLHLRQNKLICEAVDLSVDGMLLCAPIQLEDHVSLRLRFVVPDVTPGKSCRIDACGMLVHSTLNPDGRTILGVQFLNLPFRLRQLLQDYIARRVVEDHHPARVGRHERLAWIPTHPSMRDLGARVAELRRKDQ